jgi:hypothetical protein
MRRRRRHLEVSTFPFLAVLLCTMGSLILLLLVLDRRAKLVALRKAHEEVVIANDRRAQEQAEFERRRQLLQSTLAEQEQNLQDQVAKTRAKVAEAAGKLHEEQDRADRLRGEAGVVGFHVASNQQALQAQQQAARFAVAATATAKRELEEQTQVLLQMEQALQSLKALRERQKNSYSIVPYLGKRGESRRPLYVECAAAGLVFHPDGFALRGLQLTDPHIRDEVAKRIEQRQGGEPARPYLLMLVRPDGVMNYYATMGALAGMNIDFGYELIESDWVLDFSAETGNGPPQPWMAAKMPTVLPPLPAAARPVGGLGSARFTGTESSAGQAGAGGPAALLGPPGSPGPPPVPGLPRFEGSNLGGSGEGTIWQSARAAQLGGPGESFKSSYPPGPAAGGMPNGMPLLRSGSGEGGNVSASAGNGASASGAGSGPAASVEAGGDSQFGKPFEGSTSGAAGDAKVPAGNGPRTSPAGGPAAAAAAGAGSDGTAGNTAVALNGQPGVRSTNEAGGDGKGPAEKGSGIASSGSAPGPSAAGGNSEGTPGLNPMALNLPGKTAAAKPGPPHLGRLLGSRDWIIYIECHAEGIVVKYGNKRFALEALSAPLSGEHELAAMVRMMIARKQATLGAGEPPYRPMVRFQVWPDGLRAYYLTYPLLMPLRIPMARENVQP